MKMFLISSTAAVALAVVAYFILTSIGMDTASVMSGSSASARTPVGLIISIRVALSTT